MRERTGQILKIACLVLAALLLFQLVRTALRINPLAHVVIPALPLLDSETNALATADGKGTNVVSTPTKGTNTPPGLAGTNFGAAKATKETGTNLVMGVSTNLGATNMAGPLSPALSPSAGAREAAATREGVAGDSTNSPSQVAEHKTESAETNSPVVVATATNSTNNLPEAFQTNTSVSAGTAGTNIIPVIRFSTPNDTVSIKQVLFKISPSNGAYASPATTKVETSAILSATMEGTNAAAVNTNSAAKSKSKGTNSPSPSAMAMGGMNPSAMRGGGGGRPGASELPPEIKARVDRIYESEIFGMIMRPQPMALQGIAGNSAFLRAPSGQTGLVKEGDSLGELKLLKIGINRVLVEQDGKKSELTIFEGYGSESLMPKDKETSK